MDEAAEGECLWRESKSSMCGGGGVSMRFISSSSTLRVGEASAASPPSGSWIASRRAFFSLRGVTAPLPSSVLGSPSVEARDIDTLDEARERGSGGAERTNGSSSSSFGSTSHHNPCPAASDAFVSIEGRPPVPAAKERKIDPTEPLRLLPVAREMNEAGVFVPFSLSASSARGGPSESVGTEETDAPRPRRSLRGDGGAEVFPAVGDGGTEGDLSSDERGRRQRERVGEVDPARERGGERSSFGVTGVRSGVNGRLGGSPVRSVGRER